MCGIAFPTDENVIVGLEKADDAGVYKITDDIALIQTVDFFTPVVDDPYWFGRIAAANALSDVYAMGGTPKTAMNLVAFPVKTMALSVLRDIIQGGVDTLKEAGVVLIGGHSIEDSELKYGLSVTGVIHPDRVLTKHGLKPGDRLILTKPLGTGIVNTAIKGGLAPDELVDRVTRLMASLNKKAAELLSGYSVHACTDITGFGFLGHLAEMIAGSPVGAVIYPEKIPVIPGTEEFAAMGLIPGGAYKNREFRESMIRFSDRTGRELQDILFDPQTSGGLLFGVPEEEAESILARLKENQMASASIVGYITADHQGIIRV